PFIFALDAPLRRTGGEPSRGMDLRAAVVVPDVRDLPLRAAVQTVHEAGLRVVVQGGGRVVSMEPMPGANVQRGERVVLVGA
ncbi:MAG: PASTA domain-containing protein, partial [Gemmatimonadetes bacterium]|nr:PASTA domain-containing protein [Gemmatimonadota bacterium]NIS31741.1 PASTA domain-containing protein [Actinomycetota bacterium]NIU66841.1 PASTA domain-containing protein [Actinomycetota bacterium]NIW28641.1 PASTA domain-containing protein [Actinomycetota bacterium]NIX21103.1 PASTA domain-containing protein [Actinomycetota bacterium]